MCIRDRRKGGYHRFYVAAPRSAFLEDRIHWAWQKLPRPFKHGYIRPFCIGNQCKIWYTFSQERRNVSWSIAKFWKMLEKQWPRIAGYAANATALPAAEKSREPAARVRGALLHTATNIWQASKSTWICSTPTGGRTPLVRSLIKRSRARCLPHPAAACPTTIMAT